MHLKEEGKGASEFLLQGLTIRFQAKGHKKCLLIKIRVKTGFLVIIDTILGPPKI